jgi:hypothetical protein
LRTAKKSAEAQKPGLEGSGLGNSLLTLLRRRSGVLRRLVLDLELPDGEGGVGCRRLHLHLHLVADLDVREGGVLAVDLDLGFEIDLESR